MASVADETADATKGGPSVRSPGPVAFLAVALGFFLAALDATVVNVAGARLADDLDLSLSSLTWAVDGYMLPFAALLLLTGALAGRYGAKSFYMAGLALFVVASVGCALAPGGPGLVTARMVQGAAAALFLPASLVLLMSTFTDPGRRARIVALWSAAGATASGIGPVVGGLLVNSLGWRSIFWLNVPVGLLGLALTARVIRPVPGRAGEKVSLGGHVCGGLALVAASYTLIEGPEQGWGSPPILAGAVVALAACALFVVGERRSKAPVFPVRLFADARFATANAVGFLINFGLYGVLFMIGLLLQREYGSSPLQAGAQMLPMMIVFVVGNLTFARIAPTVGVRLPSLVGLSAATVLSLVMAALSSSDTPYWVLAVALSVANLGIGFTAPAMTAALMQAAGPADAGIGSAAFNANRQIGTLVGVAAAGATLASASDWYDGARVTFSVAGVAYLLGLLLVARFIRTSP